MTHRTLKILIALVASLSVSAIAQTGHAQVALDVNASTAGGWPPPAAPRLGVELTLEPLALGSLQPLRYAAPAVSALLPTLVPSAEALQSYSSALDPSQRILGDGAPVIEPLVGVTLTLDFDLDPSVGGWRLWLGTMP